MQEVTVQWYVSDRVYCLPASAALLAAEGACTAKSMVYYPPGGTFNNVEKSI
jgi:hypothetical protein